VFQEEGISQNIITIIMVVIGDDILEICQTTCFFKLPDSQYEEEISSWIKRKYQVKSHPSSWFSPANVQRDCYFKGRKYLRKKVLRFLRFFPKSVKISSAKSP